MFAITDEGFILRQNEKEIFDIKKAQYKLYDTGSPYVIGARL